MSTHKLLFSVTLPLSILSLSASIVLNCCKCESLTFVVNVMLAIFGSSFLLMISSFAGYFSEKQKYEFRYASFARSLLLQTGRFINAHTSAPGKADGIYNECGMLHSIYDDFVYENNIEIKGYFCKRGKSRKRMAVLQKSIDDLAKEISAIEFETQDALHNKKDFQLSTTITTPKLNAIMKQISLLYAPNLKEDQTNGQA